MARPIVHASKESGEDPSPRLHTGGPVDGGGSRDEAFHTPVMEPQRFCVVYYVGMFQDSNRTQSLKGWCTTPPCKDKLGSPMRFRTNVVAKPSAKSCPPLA
jgi:hypothetical protein